MIDWCLIFNNDDFDSLKFLSDFYWFDFFRLDGGHQVYVTQKRGLYFHCLAED